ncbi:MAG: 4-hydroxybenzoate octaprenyltransferase, partial [Planctomycetota bacterium]|nr:4-hydroxybenzoate octaprenyltransferase [Planctomycetota bacterium]
FAVLGAVLASPALLPGAAGSADGGAAGAQLASLTATGGAEAMSPHVRLGVQLVLVVVCMFFARTWAMLVNRLADWRFDRGNPRTARRAVASGRLSAGAGWVVALGSAAAFVAATGGFALLGNFWPLTLSVPVLAWIALYSFTKRFTLLCHVFLGAALATSPLAAALAIEPGALLDAARAETGRALWLLAGFIVLWVAGFDVAYALQDLDFDRRTGLHSIPAALGVRGALWTSRAMHAAGFALLVLAWRAEPRLGAIFGVAVGAAGVLLVIEHAVLARRGVAGLPLAFFTINGVVSCVLGAAGVAGVALAS